MAKYCTLIYLPSDSILSEVRDGNVNVISPNKPELLESIVQVLRDKSIKTVNIYLPRKEETLVMSAGNLKMLLRIARPFKKPGPLLIRHNLIIRTMDEELRHLYSFNLAD